MKKQIYGYLLLLTLAFGAYAQAGTATQESLRKHVAYLASEKLEGRRTGEPGADAAAAYMASQFSKFRLKPAALSKNGKPNYLQAFPYVTGVEMAATGNEFALKLRRADGRSMQGTPSVKPVGFSPNGSVADARVVFAGYGIAVKDGSYNDYTSGGKPVHTAGSVVLIFDGNPDNDNPHSPFGRFDLRTKALIAKEHGAVGMLVISREAVFEDDKLTRLGYDQTLGEGALPTFVVSRETAEDILGIDRGNITAFEDALIKNKGIAPKVESAGNVTAVVSFKVELLKKQVDAHNVVGILEGRDKTLKREAIVIGAHYDHLGRGGAGSLAVNSTEVHHGADDNASGSAALLELAREFAGEKKNKRTIIFIAFSGEEEGLFGSKYYVNNPIFPLDKTVAMINLDMVGRLTKSKLNIGGIGTASEFKDLVQRLNTVNKVDTVGNGTGDRFELALNDDGFGPSDHASFYGKKVPVLFFFTGTHADYHKPSDTAEKINYEGLEKLTSYVSGIFREIDRKPARPTYTVAKSSGMGGARTGFNISLGTIPSYADSTDGLVLDGVRDNSPASKAGLAAGDKIIKLAGKEIRNVMDYTYVLGEMKAGEEYEVVVLRGGETMTFKIVPVKR